MVDALRRASQWMRPDGCVIDIHPSPDAPPIDAGGRPFAVVETPDGAQRHAAPDAALRQLIDEGLFINAGTQTFDFFTWADSFDELREHIEDAWRDARVTAHGRVPSGRCRAREHVRITKLFLAQK